MKNNREYTRIPSDSEGVIFTSRGDYACEYKNLSETGFSAFIDKKGLDLERGDRISFQIVDDDEGQIIQANASVRWASESEDGTTIGCEVTGYNHDMYLYVVLKKARSAYYRKVLV